jgi:hypothetical protein
MTFVQISQVLNIALGAMLVVRLVSLRLERVYRIFSLFLCCELIVSLVEFISSVEPDFLPDYRIIWLTGRVVIWILTLWTVYALLGAVLAELPGILGLSRKVLNLTFLAERTHTPIRWRKRLWSGLCWIASSAALLYLFCC